MVAELPTSDVYLEDCENYAVEPVDLGGCFLKRTRFGYAFVNPKNNGFTDQQTYAKVGPPKLQHSFCTVSAQMGGNKQLCFLCGGHSCFYVVHPP